VAKFFPSIDHAVLLEKLKGMIRCRGVLDLCALIVASHRTPDRERPCGLPIGNLTSQLWGNFYLDALDHTLTESERHGAYLRYTDDFLLFGDDNARLRALEERIREELAAIRLRLAEPKSRMLACREGVPFCGFRFLPGKQPRVLGPTKRRFERRRATLFKTGAPPAEITRGVFAWYQFSREANSEGLRRAYSQWSLDPAKRVAKTRNE
jgi:hypothetical protein